jgi:heme/copper-type cytochrome/quinol oxidase subunit 3
MNKYFRKLLGTFFIGMMFLPTNVYAFSKLTNGLETITRTYLIPLSGAVAGASFILFVTLSYFKQEEYQKKVANVLVLSIFTGCGLELVRNIIQNFS